MSRIDDKFAELRANGEKAFIPFLTAGDPSLDATHDIVLAMEAGGADVIELGVPFSDPIADGPVIQRATERALKAGASLRGILELVRRIRTSSEIPLLLFSYFNPLLNYGLKELAGKARDVGLDGVLASDLTLEESHVFIDTMNGVGLNTVFLVAPTSSAQRIEKIARISTGFLYALSRTGVTGVTNELSAELAGFIRRLRSHTVHPIAVGFGISRPEHVRAVWEEADGAVVGSAIVHEIEKRLDRSDVAEAIGEFVGWLRGG